jgi:hypothetical protein
MRLESVKGVAVQCFCHAYLQSVFYASKYEVVTLTFNAVIID